RLAAALVAAITAFTLILAAAPIASSSGPGSSVSRVAAQTDTTASLVDAETAGSPVVVGGNSAWSYDGVLGCCVAPTSALDDIATSVGPKIRGQLADRGWTDDLIGEVVDSPTFTREVWDLTTDSAATAYARGDNFYVVVNDATGNVIQVSNINKPNWSPVWNDPKFAPPG
ncbi:MAG: hypothetical protein GY701_07460, partial [Sulfitobacter sp.]|nr:hypothetical protein [Sulfitobacter sp.]